MLNISLKLLKEDLQSVNVTRICLACGIKEQGFLFNYQNS